MTARGLFYLPIADYRGKIPFIITDLVTQLKLNDCFKVEGIFRLSSALSKLKELVNVLNSGRVTDWSSFNQPILLACALKQYLRDISTSHPLIPFELYDCMMAITQFEDQNVLLDRIKKLFGMMDTPHRMTFAYLMEFLREVASHEAENKMSPKNLAVCIAPNILSAHLIPDNELLVHSGKQIQIIQLCIQHFDVIFSEYEFDQKFIMTDEDINIAKLNPIPPEIIQQMVQRAEYRKNSLIPFTPMCWFNSPTFVRPAAKLHASSSKKLPSK